MNQVNKIKEKKGEIWFSKSQDSSAEYKIRKLKVMTQLQETITWVMAKDTLFCLVQFLKQFTENKENKKMIEGSSDARQV